MNRIIAEIVDFTGIDEERLRELINLNLTTSNLDEFGRFESLVDSADVDLVTENLSKVKGKVVQQYRNNIYLDKILRKFLLEEPFNVKDYKEYNRDSIWKT